MGKRRTRRLESGHTRETTPRPRQRQAVFVAEASGSSGEFWVPYRRLRPLSSDSDSWDGAECSRLRGTASEWPHACTGTRDAQRDRTHVQQNGRTSIGATTGCLSDD
ncbi:hypothetical protein CYV19_11040 [Natronobacterium gregoryi SP2]|uniref:Uncharacterized protein n=1 Tax=Natronobacterium gregoryi (strain ATCC 43098 / DSM 3393 / CCM 3738 / CIP 104747 / IAM 13177 / JCM 8860 / NBRC 102187 / NCIMB 2189 / SP2) TaxID=797304 RepID=L9XKL9_NATGS|nr:hypothetical protein C490_18268 [Natronobacterium gregoryi SP2]PLK20219.1 hypothetical protein CYV19_11040 [Natronobacterium gregoryi SP2]